ncbi:MAG: type IV secretory system conjugative DNA transfer family protein [Gammaproteobacteria bacterium]
MKADVDKTPDWLTRHPRQSAQLLALFAFLLWQTPAALLGLILFVLFTRLLKYPWWGMLCVGLFFTAVTFFVDFGTTHSRIPLTDFLSHLILSFGRDNFVFLKFFFAQKFSIALHLVYDKFLLYLPAFSVLFSGIFAVLDLIPNSAYEKQMRALQRGQNDNVVEAKPRSVENALEKLDERQHDGTVLGISKYSNRVVTLSDNAVNQLALVLGTTGGGKTITLRRFYQRAMMKNYPLIIVDGKPTDENTAWIAERAKAAGKPFYGFNCGNFAHYDSLASGGYTELKDKIISLKDEWSSDYYRSIAEDYLQTTFEVLLLSGEPYDLKRVVEYLDYEHLALLVRKLDGDNLMRLAPRVKRLSKYDQKDITGLQAHLSLLINSELGDYFTHVPDKTFNLRQVIENNGVVYFALPALRFPSFSSVLGKLIINDIKAVIDRESSGKRIFTVFDEFSVFAGEQVLNLVNMGRGKGIHAIFGTQGVSDLKKITPEFANQVLNCVNTLICHRLNDQDSAEAVSSWAGTRETFTLTAQVGMSQGNTGMGSVRRNKEFIVHPDAIKQELQPGEAFFISKVGEFKPDKIKVKYS